MIYKTILDNGLTIILDNDPAAKTFTCKYVVAAGSLDETGSYTDKNNFGVAHFTEHMLFKGTEKRTFEDINNDIAACGGITNAYTSKDETAFYISSPAEYWKQSLEILNDIFWHASLPEEEFIKEKTVIMEELKMYDDSPRYKIIEQLEMKINGNAHNRWRVAGSIDSVKNLTVDDIKRFMKCFYATNNVLFVATGNFSKDELLAEMLLAVQSQTNQLLPSRELEYTREVLDNKLIRSYKNDIKQAHFAFMIKGVPPYHKQFRTMSLVAGLLGGGFISRLYNIIREKLGLAYTVSVTTSDIRDSGFIEGYIGLDVANIAKVHKVIAQELNRLKKELVSREELERLKAQYKGQLLLALESVAAKTRIHESNFIHSTEYTIEDIIEQVNQVSSKDILKFAQKYFTRNNICFSIVEPAYGKDRN